MSRLGVGAMIGKLFGDTASPAMVEESLNKTIRTVVLDDQIAEDGGLVLTFTDDSQLCLFDVGRSCCERRYLTTDDDLTLFTGAIFVGVEVLPGPDIEEEDDDGDVHETAFLHVRTDRGTIVVTTHNEHNGYYDGFRLIARIPNDDGTVSRW